MPRSNEFTHGGSVGKNLVLLLRALLNIVSFTLFGYGAAMFGTANPDNILFFNSMLVPNFCLVGGAIMCIFCAVVNLFIPFAHRVK